MSLHFGSLLKNPLLIANRLFQSEHLVYLAQVFGVLAFLPLASRARSGWLLFAAPTLLMNLLSEFPGVAQMDSHYLTPALPPLFFASIEGAERVTKGLSEIKWVKWAPKGTTISAWMIAGLFGMFWLGADRKGRVDSYFDRPEFTEAAQVIAHKIPPGASVQAPDPLLAHLADRDLVFRAPPPDRNATFIILDVSHRWRFLHSEDLIRTHEEPLVRDWLSKKDVGLIGVRGGLLLFKRGKSAREGFARRYFFSEAQKAQLDLTRRIPITACLSVVRATTKEMKLELTLMAEDVCADDLAIRLGTGPKPSHVDLLFNGFLSPGHLKKGDVVSSYHFLEPPEFTAIVLEEEPLRVGTLRSSGARPRKEDPIAVNIPIEKH